MKASIAFGKCVNLVALSGYLLNIIGLLDSTSEPLQKVNGVFHLFFLVFLLTLEIQEPTPNVEYIQLFLFSFGRGLFYIWVSMILLRESIMSVVGTSITGVIGIIYVLFGSCQSCLKSDEVIAGIEEPSSSTYVFHSPAIHPDLPQYTVKDNTRR
ncbi:hypothetical protein HPULCUR_011088 [Helicostylum pulchrum]|uniref:COPI associated protein n=1 Tax=Helicostylum pulchrum TaxID=562976 RepID=A0ABP9YF33_9FUNG